jgi:hypothetical protein
LQAVEGSQRELQNQNSVVFSKSRLRGFMWSLLGWLRGGARYKPMGAPTFLFSRILEKVQGETSESKIG